MTDQERWVKVEEMIRETEYPKHNESTMTRVTFVRLTKDNWTRLRSDTIVIGITGNFIKICKFKRRS